MSNYSPAFFRLIRDKNATRVWLEGCHFHSDDFSLWEKSRNFITGSINQSGRILDIGCANGFLLRSLQEWSEYQLEPYGIDTDESLIKQAQELFPKSRDNFIKLRIEEIAKLPKYDMPKMFNLIYWNVWDNWEFANERENTPVKDLLKMLEVGGRLILGFYDRLGENNTKRIDRLKSFGHEPLGEIVNKPGLECVVWFGRK